MNRRAEQHLAKAKDYVARGEEFYRKAAEEIVAAQKADPTLSYREIGELFGKSGSWAKKLVRSFTNGSRAGDDKFVVDWERGDRDATGAKKVLREASPEEIAENYLAEPEIRQKVGRALDTHYTQQATKRASRQREKEVERKGGEDEHADYERRQRVGEIVSVARGAASSLRFVAGQVKGLNLDEDDSGATEELGSLLDEMDGFISMLRAFLGGREISDEDIAQLIGGQA